MFKFEEYTTDFEDIYIRHAFICKVMSILAVQLGATAAVLCAFIFCDDVQRFATSHRYILYICMGVTLITSLTLVCCQDVARTVPVNYVLLILFTICEAYIVGNLATYFEPKLVLTAVGVTGVVCLALALFAVQTRCDFTVCGGLMLAAIIILLLITIICMFFPSRTLMFIICGIGIFIFSIMLVIDIQMIIGGNHTNQYSPEDYIVAALSIYIDIINLFIYILILLGLLDN